MIRFLLPLLLLAQPAAAAGVYDVMLTKHGVSLEPLKMGSPSAVKAFLASLDPKLLVHTTRDDRNQSLCTRNPDESKKEYLKDNDSCSGIGVSSEEEIAADRKGDANTLFLPKHNVTVWWDSREASGIDLRLFVRSAPRLATGTAGFVLRDNPGQGMVFLLTLDGALYEFEPGALAVGPPPTPAARGVQHVSIRLEELEEADASPAMKKANAHWEKLAKCSMRAWGGADKEWDRNEAANITQRTRENRGDQILQKYNERGGKGCKGEFTKVAQAISVVLDQRAAERKATYEAIAGRLLARN